MYTKKEQFGRRLRYCRKMTWKMFRLCITAATCMA